MYYIRGTRDYGRIRNVRFAEGATAVVCGSDHGLVYVFNLQTGERLQKLDTGSGEWVQAIAVGRGFSWRRCDTDSEHTRLPK
jgi:dipeptidyl aminopeptidase/acylaminoacyl peptidase